MRKAGLLSLAVTAAILAMSGSAQTQLLAVEPGLFRVDPAAASRHNVQMTRARHLYAARRFQSAALHLDWIDQRPVHIAFFWAADDGSTLHRPAEGVFELAIFDARANWERHVTCLDAGWPEFFCSDGASRTMSAPDLQRVIFADRDFSRDMPQMPELPEPEDVETTQGAEP